MLRTVKVLSFYHSFDPSSQPTRASQMMAEDKRLPAQTKKAACFSSQDSRRQGSSVRASSLNRDSSREREEGRGTATHTVGCMTGEGPFPQGNGDKYVERAGSLSSKLPSKGIHDLY